MKLSICIPTYNRVNELKRCINSIILSPNPDLEIVVQDNASQDGTQLFMESLTDKRIKYYRNNENIGMEKNIVAVIEQATGEYVMYLTDDDYLFPDAIDNIFDFINEYNPSFFTTDIIVNFEKSKKATNYTYFDKTQTFSSSQKKEISDLYLSAHILSRVGFNRMLLSDSDLNFIKENGIGNWYPHQLFLPVMYNKGDLGYLATPIGIHTWENETYWGINPDERKVLNEGHINILIAIYNKVDYDLFVELVKGFVIKYNVLDSSLLQLLSDDDQKIISKEFKLRVNEDATVFYKKWIESLQNDNNYSLLKHYQVTHNLGEVKVGVFGTGDLANLVYEDLKRTNNSLEMIIDNSGTKTSWRGIPVYSLDELKAKEFTFDLDLIIVTIEGNHDVDVINRMKKTFVGSKLEIISWKNMFIS